jgi:excisionase family DNA binding protein
MPPSDEPLGTKALFVRIPAEHARRLDQAAGALAAPKKDLVAGLVERYVDPHDPERLEALRELATSAARPRRIEIDLGDPPVAVGHHSFRAFAPPEVLDAAQAAELLAVDEQTILALAEDGQLPGRNLAGQWRFARQALLDWLSAGPDGGP